MRLWWPPSQPRGHKRDQKGRPLLAVKENAAGLVHFHGCTRSQPDIQRGDGRADLSAAQTYKDVFQFGKNVN